MHELPAERAELPFELPLGTQMAFDVSEITFVDEATSESTEPGPASELEPALDPLDWSTAIATATEGLAEPCPACMAVGMLTRGRVIDGIQWLNCGACGRTEVKEA